MNYKIIELPARNAVGITARTNNFSPDMGKVIGDTWKRFFSEVYGNIPVKKTPFTMGIYTDYEADEKGDYTFMSACDSDALPDADGTELRIIPPGKYAEFIISGEMTADEQLEKISRLWQEIWRLDLDRSYICDFEEYRSADPNKADVHIYIGLRR